MDINKKVIYLCSIIDENMLLFNMNIVSNKEKAKIYINNIEYAYHRLLAIKEKIKEDKESVKLLEDLFLRITTFLCLSQLELWDEAA